MFQTHSTGLNYTIGVLYNDRSFFALITCLLPESVTDDLIWRICAIIQLLTSFDSDTHCFLLISVLFALLKEVENIIGESCEDLVWAYFTSKSKRKKTFWQDKVFALWRVFFLWQLSSFSHSFRKVTNHLQFHFMQLFLKWQTLAYDVHF